MAGSGRHELSRRPRVLTAAAVLAVVIAVVVASVTVLSLAGVGWPGVWGPPQASGHPLAAQYVRPAAGAVTVRRVGDDPPTARQRAHAATIAAIVTDLDAFWAATVPHIADVRFTPLRGGLTAVDSAAPSGHAPCVAGPAEINGNAFYCPTDDGIVYDASALIPVLLAQYGVAGLVATFAHEFGHAIQERIGPTARQRSADPKRYPALLIELQADCDAGAFLSWVDAGRAPHIHLGGHAMTLAFESIVDFADPPTVRRTDPAAHGAAVDRLESLVTGYRRGAAACHAMTLASASPTLGTVAAPPAGAAHRFANDAAVLAAARASVEAFDGSPVTVTADDAEVRALAPYGPVAQAAVLARAVGRKRLPAAAHPSGAACFVGAWTRSVYGKVGAADLGGRPGDADGALAAIRHGPDPTVDELVGFARGFRSGLGVCG